MHRYTGLGVVFGGIVLVAGLPTLIGIDAGPYPGATKAVVSTVAQLVGDEPESFGRVQVSQQGITLPAWYPPAELVPWSQVRSVHMTYINSKYGDYVHEIVVGRKDRETEEIRVAGLPNGIIPSRLAAPPRLAAPRCWATRRDGHRLSRRQRRHSRLSAA